ncbi:MAG: pilus assembly protein [Paracoccaceae bacterium]
MEYQGPSNDGTLPDAAMPGNRMLLNRKARRMLSRFYRDEEGVITIFAVYMVIMMVMICGIGVNLMQNELMRTKVQSTVDRAILAAADLQQTLDADDVVLDYFAKAGMSDYISADDITVTPGVSLPTSYYRIVRVEARTSTPVLYMPWEFAKAPEDRTTLPVFASGQAEEVINNVEISLVLDVSGSMNSNNRLVNLKVAAKNFVDEMIDNSRDGRLSISIIPYATQVSIPEEMMDEFSTAGVNDYSNCLNFSGSDFTSTSVVPTPAAGTPTVYQRTLHFDPWRDFDGRDNDPVELVQRPVCEEMASREVLPLTDNRDAIKTFIDNLTARGNTSIDIGMKWGTALVDPAIRPAVQGLIAGGSVSSGFGARPRDYDDLETLKVVVLMTDGANTSQYYIEDDNRDGPTNIWWNEFTEDYSVRWDRNDGLQNYDGNDKDGWFYWSSDDVWADHPKGNGDWVCGREGLRGVPIDLNGNGIDSELYCDTNEANDPARVDDEEGDAVELNYPELWAYTTIKRNVKHNFYPWANDSAADSQWRQGAYNTYNSTTKDARTKAICDAAKGPTKKITVYGIGFEAPSSGQTVIHDCASSPSHYFNVQGGEELGNAFEAIAHQITQLRLTQ